MKTRILILTALALLMLGGNAFAGVIYADTVEIYDNNGDTFANSWRTNTANALGAPNAYDTDGTSFLSLGSGGYAVFSFGQAFSTSVTIYEVTYNRPTTYIETANVYVGNDLSDLSSFTLIGNISNQTNNGAATLTFAGTYLYVMVVDTTPDGSKDGYDIDAVAVSPTPIPGAVWLLGTGLLGLIGLRGRFKG